MSVYAISHCWGPVATGTEEVTHEPSGHANYFSTSNEVQSTASTDISVDAVLQVVMAYF